MIEHHITAVMDNYLTGKEDKEKQPVLTIMSIIIIINHMRIPTIYHDIYIYIYI